MPPLTYSSSFPGLLRLLGLSGARVVLTIVLAASPAAAVDSATRGAARKLAQDGVEAYEQGDYANAAERLERAYEALPAPSLALWSGRALEKLGKLVEASERYLEATRLTLDDRSDQTIQRQAQLDAAAAREALLPRIPVLVIEIVGQDPDGVEVEVDGVPFKRALLGTARPSNPGTLEIVGRTAEDVVSQQVALVEGETRTVRLELPSRTSAPVSEAPPAPAAPMTHDPPRADQASTSWQPTTAWITLGAGVVGLAFGGVTGALALREKNDLDCPDHTCPADTEPSRLDAYDRLRTLSSVGFIAGGVLTAAGATLLLLTPPSNETAGWSPYVGVRAAGVRGTF